MATEEFVDDDPAEDMPDPDLEVIEDDLVEEVLDVDDDDADEAEATDGEDEAFDELEMRAIRRAELAMDQQGVVEASEGEFVCSNCFLVLKTSQLANPRKKICRDCAG